MSRQRRRETQPTLLLPRSQCPENKPRHTATVEMAPGPPKRSVSPPPRGVTRQKLPNEDSAPEQETYSPATAIFNVGRRVPLSGKPPRAAVDRSVDGCAARPHSFRDTYTLTSRTHHADNGHAEQTQLLRCARCSLLLRTASSPLCWVEGFFSRQRERPPHCFSAAPQAAPWVDLSFYSPLQSTLRGETGFS